MLVNKGNYVGEAIGKQASKVHYTYSHGDIMVTSSTFLLKGSLVAANTQVLYCAQRRVTLSVQNKQRNEQVL